jgi:hypothetical protein
LEGHATAGDATIVSGPSTYNLIYGTPSAGNAQINIWGTSYLSINSGMIIEGDATIIANPAAMIDIYNLPAVHRTGTFIANGGAAPWAAAALFPAP